MAVFRPTLSITLPQPAFLRLNITEGKCRDWENEEPPTVGEDQDQDHLKNLDVHKSVGPDGGRIQGS